MYAWSGKNGVLQSAICRWEQDTNDAAADCDQSQQRSAICWYEIGLRMGLQQTESKPDVLVNGLANILGVLGPNRVPTPDQLLTSLGDAGQLTCLLVELVTGLLADGCLGEQVKGLSWTCIIEAQQGTSYGLTFH